MKTEIKATFAVILAGICWGSISIFVRPLSAVGLDSFQVTCIRMTTAAFFVWTFLLLKKPALLKIELRDIYYFICTGIGSVTMYCLTYFYTIQHSEASIAVALTYTSPAFIVILSAVIYKVKIIPQKLVAVVLTFLGAALISGSAIFSVNVRPFVLAVGVASGFFYSLYTIFGIKILKKYDTFTMTAWTFIFAASAGLLLCDRGEIVRCMAADPKLIFWGLGVGIPCAAVPYILYTWGLARMDAGKAGVLSAVEPLVGCMIGMLILGESYEFAKLLGIALIVDAILIMNVHFPLRIKKKDKAN